MQTKLLCCKNVSLGPQIHSEQYEHFEITVKTAGLLIGKRVNRQSES